LAAKSNAKFDVAHFHCLEDGKMKLGEYIEHLRNLEERYSGLDIEVAQPHPTTRTDAGLYVIPAKEPTVWPAEVDTSNLYLVRRDALPLNPTTKQKGSGPDGVIIVLAMD
jgi:hypothetical protein